jgi:hypothetical protein
MIYIPYIRSDNNIKMVLKDTWYEAVDRILLAQNRDNFSEHGNEHSGSIKMLEIS